MLEVLVVVAVWTPEVAETATKPLQKHSLGYTVCQAEIYQ